MAWRLAYSLDTLRSQLNAAYPNRSKASDGTIGDQSHASGSSDHNPNAAQVVCAMDITHHPGYLDAHKLADRLIVNRHPNLKYIISNRRIAGSHNGWKWAYYSGSNPHDKHVHFSVGRGLDGQSTQPYDDRVSWDINVGGEDMITNSPSDIAALRIAHSEAGGWDVHRTHAGEFDQIFVNAWQGKPWSQMLYNQWVNGAAYRTARLNAQKNNCRPTECSQRFSD